MEPIPASVHSGVVSAEQVEIPLDEDKEVTSKGFNGTLQLNAMPDNAGADLPEVEFRHQEPAETAVKNRENGDSGPGVATVDLGGGGDAGQGLTRNRPFSASMISRRTTDSTASRTSLSPNVYQSDMAIQHFFSHRDGIFDRLMNDCINRVIVPDRDGEVKGAWILILIDHWDKENEKVFIVTETSLLIVSYDFIKEKITDSRRILLELISTVQMGDIVYPTKSFMYPRQHGGVRLTWGNDEETTFGQRWNPWCTTLPYMTIAHHPILYNPKEHDTVIYNVDDFFETVLDAVEKAQRRSNSTLSVSLVEQPILIENYGSVMSVIYNQSWLGYNRDRNGVSF